MSSPDLVVSSSEHIPSLHSPGLLEVGYKLNRHRAVGHRMWNLVETGPPGMVHELAREGKQGQPLPPWKEKELKLAQRDWKGCERVAGSMFSSNSGKGNIKKNRLTNNIKGCREGSPHHIWEGWRDGSWVA